MFFGRAARTRRPHPHLRQRSKAKASPGGGHRRLAFQQLEPREMLSGASFLDRATFQEIDPMEITVTTGEKPQSKVWYHAHDWWSVLPNDSGTWLWRLDGTAWNQVLKLSPEMGIRADVKPLGDLAHVLLYDGPNSQFVSLEYAPGTASGYQFWSMQPELVDVVLSGAVETATIDVDSTGRLWLASDGSSTVEVRYSDYPYESFSPPITVAAGISSDDISAITALGDNSIGVLWSNQNAKRFGFRVHADGTDPATWTPNEVPASQSAKSVGGGMADDHLNIAVASDGTLYAAVKTSYDSGGQAKIALLVRRPSGDWDPLYAVDTLGTRPIVVLSEKANRLIVAYAEWEDGGVILGRESPLDAISFGPRQVLISGNVNDVSSTKQDFGDELVVIASASGHVWGTRIAVNPVVDPSPSWVTVSFQDGVDGYGGTRDTKIKAAAPEANYGEAGELKVDGDPDEASLIRWDISSIPAGSLVQSANVTLNVTNVSSHGYELYQMTRDWSEQDATWNQPAPGEAWEIAGAQGVADRGSTVLGSISADVLGPVTIELNAAGLEVVQAWLDDAASNYGLIFQDYVDATNGLKFSSREAPEAGDRPKLTIAYLPADSSPGPVPPQNQAPTVDAGPDQVVKLSLGVRLFGTVRDDGLPEEPGAVATGWSKVSGPGDVAFANVSSAETIAKFTAAGTYVLRLTADDGELTASDETTVTVEQDPDTRALLTADLDGSGQDEVIIDFGAPYGVWIWRNDSRWEKLHQVSPASMAAGDLDGTGGDDLLLDFGPYGIWIYGNDQEWARLHRVSPQQMVTGDVNGDGKDEAIVDFGGQYGIWRYYPASDQWKKLHDMGSAAMVAGDVDGGGRDDVIIDFGDPYGVWIWKDDSRWEKLHTLSPASMVTGNLDGTGGDDVLLDFGPYGIWIYPDDDQQAWTKLHNVSPQNMVTGDVNSDGKDEVIVGFGGNDGLWRYYPAADEWEKLDDLSGAAMASGDLDGEGRDDLIIDFGDLHGIWIWKNDSGWEKLDNGAV